MDEQMKNILRYALILFLIAAVVAGLLAGVNLLTKDTIAQNEIAAEQQALGEVMPDAQTFEPFDAEVAQGFGVAAVYAAADAAGTAKGYCVKVAQNGYGGAISAVVGVGLDGKVTGVSIISHAETPGLGAKCTDPDFLSQFTGKPLKKKLVVKKTAKKEREVQAITASTITSNAVVRGINEARSHYFANYAAQAKGGV